MTIYVPPGTPSAVVATMLAEAHPLEPPSRRARRRPIAPPTPPRPAGPFATLHADRLVMSVPLVGELAAGKRFVVDLLDYDRMKTFVGVDWTLTEPQGKRRQQYVISSRQQARKAAGDRSGSASCLRLARWLSRAGEGEVVTYADGDTLNLTRGNMAVVGRKEHWESHRVVPLDRGHRLG